MCVERLMPWLRSVGWFCCLFVVELFWSVKVCAIVLFATQRYERLGLIVRAGTKVGMGLSVNLFSGDDQCIDI